MSLKSHAALIAVLTSAALTAARLLAISRFDVNTAATILQVSGTSVAVAGTALTLLPYALVLVVCILAVAVFIDGDLLDVPTATLEITLWITLGATLCLTATALFVAAALFVVAASLIGRYLRRRGADTGVAKSLKESKVLRAQATILLALIVMTPIVAQRPWLPEEAIVDKSQHSLVGYVLGTVDERLAVMNAADRTVSFVALDQVATRYICRATSGSDEGSVVAGGRQIQLSGSVVGQLLWGRNTPKYPSCPHPSATT